MKFMFSFSKEFTLFWLKLGSMKQKGSSFRWAGFVSSAPKRPATYRRFIHCGDFLIQTGIFVLIFDLFPAGTPSACNKMLSDCELMCNCVEWPFTSRCVLFFKFSVLTYSSAYIEFASYPSPRMSFRTSSRSSFNPMTLVDQISMFLFFEE